MKKLFKTAMILTAVAALMLAGCAQDTNEQPQETIQPSGGDDSGSGTSGGGASASVSSVTLNLKTLNLAVDDTATLVATVSGSNLTNAEKAVTWSSSLPSVVSVDNGVVKAVAAGTARVTVTSVKDTTKSAYCDVTVENATTQESVKTEKTVGTTPEAITYSYTGTGADVYFYSKSGGLNIYGVKVGSSIWKASDFASSNATIDTTVNLTSNGVTLTAITTDASNSMSIDSSKKTIDSTEFTHRLKLGGAGTKTVRSLKLTLTSATTVVFYVCSSSGTDSRTMVIETIAKDAGAVTIVRPTSVSINKSSDSLVMTDSAAAPTLTLTATVMPSNVTAGYGNVTWSSDKTSVATVSNGVVTATGAGNATITATTCNGLTATCTVTVTDSRTPASVNYIKKTDTPVGYASIDVSKMTKSIKVSNKTDFKKYVTAGGYIVYVDGKIDLSEGMMPSSAAGTTTALDNFVKSKTNSTYTSYKTFIDTYTNSCSSSTNHKDNPKKSSWSECTDSTSTDKTLYNQLWYLNSQYGNTVRINPASNTMIVGLPGAEIYGGAISINSVNNVAIRNVTIRDAYDPFPHHEDGDGFNAEFDCIVIQGSSYNIWIDHCTLKDSYHCEKAANGEKFQTYDGLCDMKGSIYNLTVSYTRLQDHDKTMLIGSSDTDGSNETRTITLHHNYFLNCGQRLPMARNSKLHNFNNYYDTDSNKYWSQSYCVGVRAGILIVSENNYFGSGVQYSYKDSYGKLYKSGDTDNSSKGCNSTTSSSKPFTPTYTYTLDNSSTLNTTVPDNAGAGKWTVPSSEYSSL